MLAFGGVSWQTQRMPDEILVFSVSGRPFALRVIQVREVLRAVALTGTPRTDPPLEGILNLRGLSVGVLDLRTMLSLPPLPLHPDQYLIILVSGRSAIGDTRRWNRPPASCRTLHNSPVL